MPLVPRDGAELFESDAIASVLNEHFVPVKVDREERPDVDCVDMAFVQATTGSGGWPMSVWLTPELKPFYGGTYFRLLRNGEGQASSTSCRKSRRCGKAGGTRSVIRPRR